VVSIVGTIGPIPHTQTVHVPPAFTQEESIFDPMYDSDKNGLTATDLGGGGTEIGRAQLQTTESYPYAYKTGSRMSSAAGLEFGHGAGGTLNHADVSMESIQSPKGVGPVNTGAGKFAIEPDGMKMYSSQFDVEANVDRMSELLDRDVVDFADWVHDP
jgi:hypothetical protein